MRIFITDPMQQPLGQLKYGGRIHLMNELPANRDIRPFGKMHPCVSFRPLASGQGNETGVFIG